MHDSVSLKTKKKPAQTSAQGLLFQEVAEGPSGSVAKNWSSQSLYRKVLMRLEVNSRMSDFSSYKGKIQPSGRVKCSWT